MLSWLLVQEQSMEPQIFEGDFVLIEKMSYRFLKPRVGHIVAARHPLHQSMLLVKRIIKEKQGFYWIEGDNAEKSIDSRHFGWLKREYIVGKVVRRCRAVEQPRLLARGRGPRPLKRGLGVIHRTSSFERSIIVV